MNYVQSLHRNPYPNNGPHPSLPNHILATILPHPHLMYPASLDIHPLTYPVSSLPRVFVTGICNRHATTEDQVRGEAAMGVGSIVRISMKQMGSQNLKGFCIGMRSLYRPSVQAKTWEKPQERTRDSASTRVSIDGVWVGMVSGLGLPTAVVDNGSCGLGR